ncbi:MAG: putative toxin-antitoxin system toxin component, PIN family [Lacipirellulaceae bacterium]
MRVVLDTNVIVSGLLSPGHPPASLLDWFDRGLLVLVTSAEQVDELRDVLARPRIATRLTAGVAARFLDNLASKADLCGPLPLVTASPDPKDDFLLATALAGNAALIVTGDKRHLLSLGSFERIAIVTATEALSLVDST